MKKNDSVRIEIGPDDLLRLAGLELNGRQVYLAPTFCDVFCSNPLSC